MEEEPTADPEGISDTRLYGSAIAVVSGLYSVFLATMGVGMSTNAWFMLVLGIVVLVHGLFLLTPRAATFQASGPLMLLYSLLMLLDQAWLATRDGGMPGAMDPMTGMTWDPGMIALALLMLISGAIMTARGSGRASM